MGGHSVLSLESIKKKIKTIVNLLLLLFQLVAVAAYFGIVSSKSEFKEISENIYPNCDFLMNSIIADLLISYPALIIICAIFILSIIKEIKIKQRAKKIFINSMILTVIVLMFCIASYKVYFPIGVT